MQMKLIAATFASLSLFASAPAARTGAAAETGAPVAAAAAARDTQRIIITRNGSRPSQRGPAENFTASVCIDPLFDANDADQEETKCGSGSWVRD